MRRRKTRPPDFGFTNCAGCGEGQSSWDTGGMYTVEIYGRVRRAVLVEGKSERAVAQEFGIARETVRKMLRYSVPPGYRRERPVKRPKLGPWIGVIDAILEEDKNSPVKQRHTAKRIFDRLRQEYAYTGGYTIVKDYVRLQQVRTAGDVRATDPRAWESTSGFRRSLGDCRRSEMQGALLRHGLAAVGRLLRGGVSGGDDGSVSGRTRARLCLF